MLVLSRVRDQEVFAGVYPGYKGVPLVNTVVDTGSKVRLGYQAKTSSGEQSDLLSISRDDITTSFKAEDQLELLNKQLNLLDNDKSLLKNFFVKKVFFKNLGITNFDNLNQAINKFKEKSPDKIQEIIQFVSLIKNGAFFKHWADHYAEQAKKMAQSLGLAA
jgi:hypothetical protein